MFACSPIRGAMAWGRCTRSTLAAPPEGSDAKIHSGFAFSILCLPRRQGWLFEVAGFCPGLERTGVRNVLIRVLHDSMSSRFAQTVRPHCQWIARREWRGQVKQSCSAICLSCSHHRLFPSIARQRSGGQSLGLSEYTAPLPICLSAFNHGREFELDIQLPL